MYFVDFTAMSRAIATIRHVLRRLPTNIIYY